MDFQLCNIWWYGITYVSWFQVSSNLRSKVSRSYKIVSHIFRKDSFDHVTLLLLKDNLENGNDLGFRKKTYRKRRYTYFTVLRTMISYYIYVFMHNLVSLIFFHHQCKFSFFIFMLHKTQFPFMKSDWCV